MVKRTSHKTCIFTLWVAFLTAWLSGCASPVPASNAPAAQASQTKSTAQRPPASEPPLYFGENWEQAASGKPTGSTPPKGGASTSGDAAPRESSIWSLVLGTFSNEAHEQAAHQMLANLPTIAPQVQGARVHTTAKGSMVVYGKYTGRDDPRVAADETRLKAITYQGRPVFNRVILTRLDMRMQGQLHPYDLLSARRAHPKVDPMYTLDVALWMSQTDDPKDRLPYDEAKRRAESYASQLRAKGDEAYFYHDDERQWSIVTVGLFDRRAINPRSGLFSEDVTQLMKRFPERLVNGEPLEVYKDPKRPSEGTYKQPAKLVLVPMM